MAQLLDATLHADDRRRHPRIRVDVAAKLITEADTAEARLEDLAAGGAFVRTECVADVGVPVTLRLRMLRDRVCEARGIVVRHERDVDHSGFAVAFEQTNADMNRFVRNLGKLPAHLRLVYLADIIEPRLELSTAS